MKKINFSETTIQLNFQYKIVPSHLRRNKTNQDKALSEEQIREAGEALAIDRSFADDIETRALDFMFENGLVKVENVKALGTTRLVFDDEALKKLDSDKIENLQRLLQKDGTYPKGEAWIDGDVLSGTKTIEAARSTFNTNIVAYTDAIKASGGEINIGLIQAVGQDSIRQK